MVTRMREMQIDHCAAGPEFEMECLGPNVSLEAFAPGYGVALQLMLGRGPDSGPDAEQTTAAFDRYQRGRADFY